MGAFNIGVTTVITSNAEYIHESFDRTGITTESNYSMYAGNEPPISGGSVISMQFGRSVAVGSGRIVVGGPSWAYSSNVHSGNGYIYDLKGNDEYILAVYPSVALSGYGNDVRVGWSVAVGETKAVFGSDGSSAGKVWITDLEGNQEQYITGNNTNGFGEAVAIGSSVVAIGEKYYNSGQGGVHLYTLSGSFIKTITASDHSSGSYDQFGWSVAIGHGKIVVGCNLDDIGGNSSAGSAYIFDKTGYELKKLTASDDAAGDRFGYSVAIGCGKIVVGSDTSESAYVYDLQGENEIILTSPDGSSGDQFGFSVAVGYGYIAVGAKSHTSSGNNQGAVYLYDTRGNFIKKLTQSGSDPDAGFGYSVSIGCGKIVVGSPGSEGGSKSNDSGDVYIYNIPETSDTYWESVLETLNWKFS